MNFIDFLLDYRPLAFAVIELGLAILVLLKGKGLRDRLIFAAVLACLGFYQLGEFFIIVLGWTDFGAKFAFFSTTLLPPLGILLLQRLTGNNYGYIFWQFLGSILALGVLLVPGALAIVGDFHCVLKFVRGDSNFPLFTVVWEIYYFLGLVLSLGIIIQQKLKFRNLRRSNPSLAVAMQRKLNYFLVAYLAFFPTGLVLSIFLVDASLATSLTCSLAIVTAFILAKFAVTEELVID